MLVVVKKGNEYTSYTLISIEVDSEKGISFFCRDPLDRFVTIRPPRVEEEMVSIRPGGPSGS